MYVRAVPPTIHYSQIGGGTRDKYYQGARYISSGGGAITDFLKHIIPIIASRAAPYVGDRFSEAKREAKEALESGSSMGKALKRGLSRAWSTTKSDVSRKLRGGGRKTHKKRHINRNVSDVLRRAHKRPNTIKKKDFFVQ